MDNFDDRNMFRGYDMWENLASETDTHWAALQPLKATTDNIRDTLRVLCGNGNGVTFSLNQPPRAQAEVMYLCQFFVEYDGIARNEQDPRGKNKLCLSLRATFYGADLPGDRHIRHSYPDPPKRNSEPLGPIFLAMVIHRYDERRHRLILAPMSGDSSVINFWRRLVKELKQIYSDADCEARDLTIFGLPIATNYILDEEQADEQSEASATKATTPEVVALQTTLPLLPKINLSSLETAIANLKADGLAEKEIAKRLGKPVNTVHTHVKRIAAKVGGEGNIPIRLYVAGFGTRHNVP